MMDPEQKKLRQTVILCGGLLAFALMLAIATFLAVEILMPFTS